MPDKKTLSLFSFALLIASIGFCAGINYCGILGNKVYASASGCFEFGLFALLKGKKLNICIKECALSTLKNYAVFLAGAFSWLTFLLVPMNLFGLSFKMGVCLDAVATRNCDILSIIQILIICIMTMVASSGISAGILNRRIYHFRYNKRLDLSDKIFFEKSLTALFVFFSVISAIIAISYYTDTGLKVFFDSVL